MSVPVQVLLIFVSVLLSALVTVLVSQVVGLRSDMRAYQRDQKDLNEKMAEDQKRLSDRVLTLEAEHKANTCQYAKARVN